ncbi:hypothetical protein P350_07290 [Burkholderia cepacia JBK9]|uniref:hypothetical protein n=1 Tax=Burkholderia arboris TaxID=488730 RepID=UPI0004D64D28|nr:hypothetical protein [Burkholderia arboris]ALX11364.1 hypothetical protein P350_07290 [Burkholderia cepacia JBK9]MCA8491134.1 hypothetical protein [Burkholderia arboris]
MADTVGKARSQLREMKAAQLGVSDFMSSYIAKGREAKSVHHGLNFATAAARREMLFSRMRHRRATGSASPVL